MKKMMVIVMTVVMIMVVFSNAAFAAGKTEDQPKKGLITTVGETAKAGAKAVGNAAVATAEVAVGGVIIAGEAVGSAACKGASAVRTGLGNGVAAVGNKLSSFGAWIKGGDKK